VFYPPSRGRAKGFDELSFYAGHFNTVEVNSTFYGQPRAEVSKTWVARTPPGFEFSVKLYKKFTHPKMVDLEPATVFDIDEFKRGIDPLASAGKLGALLAQFPPSFKSGPASLGYLNSLLEAFAGYELAVELRHKSWSDAFGETLSLLKTHGAAFVQIDEPKFKLSIAQNQLPNIPTFYYMRLHGRNAAQWWTHEKAEDRYNYLYSAEEVSEFVETVGAAREIVKKAYLYTNNHFSAKSVANAAMIKKQLGEPLEGEYPGEFRERYPELAGVPELRNRK
jgi:uncharacterized protein YecE (DUF72 family)